MGPLTARAWREMTPEEKPRLESAGHVLIDKAMWDRLYEIAISLPPEVDFEGRLPFPATVVEVEGYASMLMEPTTTGKEGPLVAVHLLSEHEGMYSGLWGAYMVRGNQVHLGKNFKKYMAQNDLAIQNLSTICAKVDLLFSFMLEPRFIAQSPVDRHTRRRAGRMLPEQAMKHTWVKIGWTIGGSTRPKVTTPGSAPQRPFHIVRAHWRLYDRQTPKGERRPHREGWWVWIESHYSGNPALGEIKHHYTPKIEDPGKSSRIIHQTIAARIAQTVNPQT